MNVHDGDEDEKLAEPPAPPKPKMSVLRRHRILSDDVRRVIAHLKAHKKITKDDILNRPRLKKKKGEGPGDPVGARRALWVLAAKGSKARAEQHGGPLL